jgi:gluconokinase
MPEKTLNNTRLPPKMDHRRTAWFLGIDLGTGSCKSVVVDEAGQVLGFGVSQYTWGNAPGRWQEQDPDGLVAGMIHSARAAIEQAGVEAAACQSLSMGGALHTLMALDRADRPLTGVITWADGRSAPQAQAIRQSPLAAELYQQTGCPVNGMYPLYKICWLRQEHPEVFEQAARFVTAKEYVFERLTGERMADYAIASGSGLFNIHTLHWNTLSLDLAEITEDKLAPLTRPLTLVRGLDATMAAALGIPPQTLVVLGSSDAGNSSLGTGAVHPWQATCMVGTSGAFRMIAPRPALDEKARLWCYMADETTWLVGGAINNGGIALSWLKDALTPALTRQPQSPELTFDDLVSLAGQVEAGAGGLVCLPFFAGERSPNWNENARAVFFGLTLQHDLRHLARAVLEGVAFRLRSLNEILSDMVGDIREVHASGGFTHSTLWPQIIASAVNRDLLVPTWGETSARGAAFWAMRGAGALPTFEKAGELVSIGSQFHPVASETAVYDKLYRISTDLYGSVATAFDQVAEFQRGQEPGRPSPSR